MPPGRQRGRQVHPDQDARRRSCSLGGELIIDGEPMVFESPRDALDHGIATVYQDLALVPLLSVSRKLLHGPGTDPRLGPLRRFDAGFADRTTAQEMAKIGIDVRDPGQPVGTMSGGRTAMRGDRPRGLFRRQGADPGRADLGPGRQAGLDGAALHRPGAVARGLGVIFITHNVHHAYPVGDKFLLLKPRPQPRLFRQGGGHAGRGAEHDGRRQGAGVAGIRAGRVRPRRRGPPPARGGGERQIAKELHAETEAMHPPR